MRIIISLISRSLKPSEGLLMVLSYALSILIHYTQIILRQSIALLCQRLKQFKGLIVIT